MALLSGFCSSATLPMLVVAAIFVVSAASAANAVGIAGNKPLKTSKQQSNPALTRTGKLRTNK
ncbi:MAG: hypothetical protein IPO31_10460 [Candidatus Obscuribacter sp.]|nr:hypothetical protein [Candidatus Obscuribacter sp.]